MPLTGVTGWPVAHSRSPALHAAAFRELGLDGWHSQRLPLPPEVFEEAIRALPVEGFIGVNVTIPHKPAALELADVRSETATSCGAANTLTFRDGRIHAENTDVPAIESAVRELLGGDAAGATVLVLGAGGTARAALLALARCGVEDVQVWNRTPARAERLAVELGGSPVTDPGRFDLVVNTTSVGLDGGGSLDDLPLSPETLAASRGAIDLVYGTGGAPVATAARRAGLAVIDGLEILVRQGALSIAEWSGRTPDLDPLRAAVADPA